MLDYVPGREDVRSPDWRQLRVCLTLALYGIYSLVSCPGCVNLWGRGPRARDGHRVLSGFGSEEESWFHCKSLLLVEVLQFGLSVCCFGSRIVTSYVS